MPCCQNTCLSSSAEGELEEEPEDPEQTPLSAVTSGNGEQGDVVFSTSMPVAFQGRPEDDWTLEARYTPLIIGGQVSPSPASLHGLLSEQDPV